MTNQPPREFEQMKNSTLYKSATLSEKIQIAIDHKHYSLESGADANHELFHYLIPSALEKIKRLEEQVEALNEDIRQYKISNEYLRESNHISHGNNMLMVDELVKAQKENDALKAQVDELSGHSLAQADEIKQLKIYLTNYQNDMIEKNKLLEIAVKALNQLENNEVDPRGLDHDVGFITIKGIDLIQDTLEQIQKMRGGE